jgi:hypothetical protein
MISLLQISSLISFQFIDIFLVQFNGATILCAASAAGPSQSFTTFVNIDIVIAPNSTSVSDIDM